MSTPSLARRLARDVDAHFPDLVTERRNAIYSGVMRLVRNPEDAADVTQETFVRAYKALSEYQPERIGTMSIDGWLWTIALNLCRSRARVRRPVLVPLDGHHGHEASAEAAAVRRLESDELEKALRLLPPPQREAIVLHHIVGLTYADMAEATGRPQGTLKTQVSRGVARLATIMKGQ